MPAVAGGPPELAGVERVVQNKVGQYGLQSGATSLVPKATG